MYKTKNILKFAVSMLFVVATFTACVKDSDFDTPQVACDNSFINDIASSQIMDMNSLVTSSIGQTFEIASLNAPDVYIKGYVTSNDFKGNFYKELFIQDDISEPTAALKINIDQRSLYTKYPVGSLIYIKLNGLTVADIDGTITIGEVVNGYFSDVRQKIADKNIVRSCEIKQISGIEINSTSEINNSLLGKYIQLNDSEFDIRIVGLPYADRDETYSTHRNIILCSDESEIFLEISSFAAFRDLPLPSEKFTISGILSRDYRDRFYVLKINDVSDVVINNSERCGPTLLECTGATATGANVIFSEDFENISDESDLIALGWTNVNVNGGSHIWIDRSYGGNTYMQNGAYNTNENPLEAWLVTPTINLDGSTDEVFTFDVNVGYYRGAALSVYASTDFTGDVETATWQLINNIDLPTLPTNGYGAFRSAGNISVDCLDGDVVFAFKYLGGDGDVTTTFQVDNVKVTGN